MQTNTDLIKFPAANISIRNWNTNEDYLVYILQDEFIYTASNKIYHTYFSNHLFVDSNGNVYKVVDRKLPNTFGWLMQLLPTMFKAELVLARTTEHMTLDQVRQHMLNQLERLLPSDNKTEWITMVKNAKTYEEIIFS